MRGFGAGVSFFDAKSFDKLEGDRVFEVLVHGDEVLFFQFVGRVGQPLGEFTIVGEDEEAFGIEVEAPHMLEVMVFVREEIVDGLAAAFVIARANDPTGLVEGDDEGKSGAKKFFTQSHLISADDSMGRVCADRAVDAHGPVLHELVRLTT